MKNKLINFWNRTKAFFRSLQFWKWQIMTQERIEYLVELQIACRDKFKFQFDVKSKSETKQVEKLLTKVYYNSDGSLRTGAQSRTIARKIASGAAANMIKRKNQESKKNLKK